MFFLGVVEVFQGYLCVFWSYFGSMLEVFGGKHKGQLWETQIISIIIKQLLMFHPRSGQHCKRLLTGLFAISFFFGGRSFSGIFLRFLMLF